MEVFTPSWDKCQHVLKDLWLDTDLSDVSLVTEDNGQIGAHKVILAQDQLPALELDGLLQACFFCNYCS